MSKYWNWKTKLLAILVGLLMTAVVLSNLVHGGIKHQAKNQVLCIRDGASVDRNSNYSWILNTCVINRGSDDEPKWVESKRDMAIEDTSEVFGE